MSEEMIERIEQAAQASHDKWIAGVRCMNLGRSLASVAMQELGKLRRERQINARTPRHTIDVDTAMVWSL